MYYVLESASLEIITLLRHLSSLTADFAAKFPDTVNDVPILYFYSLLPTVILEQFPART